MLYRVLLHTRSAPSQDGADPACIKLRYLGVDKNHAWLRTRCAAINLRTLINSGLTRSDTAWAMA
jgi:hypothetical protein